MRDAAYQLRKIRENLGYTQEVMAELVNMSVSGYNRLENGKTEIKMKHVIGIAGAVNKTQEEIFQRLFSRSEPGSDLKSGYEKQQNEEENFDKQYFIDLLLEKERIIKSLEDLVLSLKNQIELMGNLNVLVALLINAH